MWWLAHRPLQYAEFRVTGGKDPTYVWTNWTPCVRQTDAGDLKMVTEWAKLGFIVHNPFLPPAVCDTAATGADYIYVSVEPQER